GLGQMLTGSVGAAGGAAIGGTGGAALGVAGPLAVGAASKATSNTLTRRALNHADEMVRMRSDLYRRLLGEAPMEGASPPAAEALIGGLMTYRPDNRQMNGGGW